jgi:hypothetical protein
MAEQPRKVNFLEISLAGLVHSGSGGLVLAVNNLEGGFAGSIDFI